MTYIEQLEYDNLKKELKKQEKIFKDSNDKLEYDPTTNFLKHVDLFNNEKNLNKKLEYAKEAEHWRQKAIKFDVVKYIDKWQHVNIDAQFKINDITSKIWRIEKSNGIQ